MNRSHVARVVIACSLLVLPGCGDMIQTIMRSPESQAKVMDLIGGDAEMAGRMTDKLLSAEGSRRALIDHLMGNGEAMQTLMARVARDPTALDAVIGLAVQDSTMREHVMTLFKGMQMARQARP